MYDEGSLGEVESLTELVDYLEEYENEWCITSEKGEDWKSAILSKCRHLFSMDHDPEKVCRVENRYECYMVYITQVHTYTHTYTIVKGGRSIILYHTHFNFEQA